MTTTPAQIAALEFYATASDYDKSVDCGSRAKAALTAAAEAREPTASYIRNCKVVGRHDGPTLFESPGGDVIVRLDGYIVESKEEREATIYATIERCAQIALEHATTNSFDGNSVARAIAAAITAAGEWKEGTNDRSSYRVVRKLDPATLERCALLVDKAAMYTTDEKTHEAALGIAAAIRALKESRDFAAAVTDD